MASWTGFALADCMYDETGNRVRSKYTDVGQAVFGRRGENFVLWVQMSNLCAVGVVYLVLIGSTMHSVQPLISDSSLSWLSHADQRLWTMVAVCFVMPTVHMGGYKKLAALSALGILCLLAIIVVGTGCALQTIADNKVRQGHLTERMPSGLLFVTAQPYCTTLIDSLRLIETHSKPMKGNCTRARDGMEAPPRGIQHVCLRLLGAWHLPRPQGKGFDPKSHSPTLIS